MEGGGNIRRGMCFFGVVGRGFDTLRNYVNF